MPPGRSRCGEDALSGMQVTRNNHYVPRWYLKQWTGESGKLLQYRLLVSHASVPKWEPKSCRAVGYRSDLYTSERDGLPSDAFERWLEEEYERPAQAALKRVLADQSLQPQHWQHLGRYVLCQQIRTPQDLFANMQRWGSQFSGLIESVLGDCVQRLEEAACTGKPIPARPLRGTRFPDTGIKIEVARNTDSDTGAGEVGVSVLLDREFWIDYQRYMLERIGWRAARHSWSIATPAGDAVWFTSDQPVLRLSFSEAGFDLDGGWALPTANICMPLSPRHMLFTQIEDELPPRITFDHRQTRTLQRALAQRAHRVVFADRRLRLVEEERPRMVDPETFHTEEEEWKRWHEEQVASRRAFESGE